MRDRYASLREGLVGAWIPSVSGSGLLLPDLSGQGNNGTLTNMGPEDWVAGEYGRALDFDGSNDFAQTSLDPFFIQNTLNFTVAAWAKRFSDVRGAFAATTTTSNDKGFKTGFENLSGFGFKCASISIFQGIGNNDLNYRSPDDSLDTEWNQVTFTGDGTIGGVKIYINGISQPITTSHRGTWSGPSGASTRDLQIAKTRTSTVDPFIPFNGQLDDIRIYNRALSESEIKLLASSPGIGLRPQRRTMYYAPPTGARRRRILTSMP